MKNHPLGNLAEQTGALYGDLWHRYTGEGFTHSVSLIYDRMIANSFDFDLIKSRECIDLGCGGGRGTALMLELGAEHVTAVDISKTGLSDAAKRLRSYENVNFVRSSCLALEFPDHTFDFAWCSGVLHHTEAPEQGLRELLRILRPGGAFFLLLYGAGGLRWQAVEQLRPIAQKIGYSTVDKAAVLAGLPPSKQRHFLDDLFVPIINYYTLSELTDLLALHGIETFHHWEKGKPSDETDPRIQKQELESLRAIFSTFSTNSSLSTWAVEAGQACNYLDHLVERLTNQQAKLESGELNKTQFDNYVFGYGHHRIHAIKP
jgi:SAM-dependent methyltransferase